MVNLEDIRIRDSHPKYLHTEGHQRYVSANDEPFEDEAEPIEEEEQHDEEFGGVPTDRSPYLDSFSHQDLADTKEEDLEFESSLEIVAPLPPSSSQPFGFYALGPNTIITHTKFIPIPSRMRAASLTSSPRSSKKPYPTHKDSIVDE
ncbi:unnamed protein product [Lactuca saligna]|uniref:Uncharacterized protein n=1 Tax=Lactuca saligna TaxID=75948 RepID=A0AA35XZA9_LACSI|nr:unnamed protein product [Lactuca saligna]